MSQVQYRRRAILSRIRSALDAFYMLQDIDWEYDLYSTLERIIGLALEEIEFEGGRPIQRALIILESSSAGELEVHAGWKTDDLELSFSRTVVEQTMESSEPILCENAKDDPRFMEAESIKQLETLSLISVPIRFDGRSRGALYIESKNPGDMFHEGDLEFLEEFARTLAPYLRAGVKHDTHLQKIRDLSAEIEDRYQFSRIIGRSESMRNVFDLVRIAADVDRTVLITGESGSGKELVAHAIHYNGRRRGRPFVVVDCSSLSEHLLESELFGHRKGAFTGAGADKIGAFEEANGGTIFLDEISDASKALQQKLRRVLQEGEIRRVGDNLPRTVDVRVICATNKDLSQLVESGEFIRDLYFRVNKFPVRLPALRERREDIPLLVHYFLERATKQDGARRMSMHPSGIERLMRESWSENNVRELRNAIELAADLCQGDEITAEVIERVFRVQKGESLRRAASPADAARSARGLVSIDRTAFRELIESTSNETGRAKKDTPFYRVQLELGARAIVEGLRAADWKLRPAARLLGISPTKLRTELRAYLETELARAAGDVAAMAATIDIPVDVIEKKANDLGLEGLREGESE